MSLRERLHLWRELSKSGIVTLVLISVLAGYLIGQPPETSFEPWRMVLTLLGVMFLAAGSSALNQYQEKDIDSKMPRTAGRPLPSGRIQPRQALIFIVSHILIGLAILSIIHIKIFILGLMAVLSYNGLYTLWWKRHWAYAAVPGAVPGALPILMGYAAATGQVFDAGGIYLFLILFFWQMPHFWVLALRYQADYKQGGFPTLPVVHGEGVTLHQIVVWCLAYVGLAIIGPFFLPVRWIYWIPTFLMSAKVLYELFAFMKNPEGKRWLHFFLWVNFSLVIYLAAAAIDLWSLFLPIPHFTR